MAERVTLELLKKHVRADDFDDDDALLMHYLSAAWEYVDLYTQRDCAIELADPNGCYPAPIVQAILLLVGHWYNQREAVGAAQNVEVPYAMSALLKPYRRFR